jgi:amino acid adenylation domain-containing protein
MNTHNPEIFFSSQTPFHGFHLACHQHSNHVALEIGNETWTYTELFQSACRLANAIKATNPDAKSRDKTIPGLIAVCGSRTLPAYTGTLAVFATGHAHVALNPQHPPNRSLDILDQSGARILIGDHKSVEFINTIADNFDSTLKVYLPDVSREELASLAPALKPENTFTAEDIAGYGDEIDLPYQEPDDLAYLVFTSGSTGKPKGVAISHGNLAKYMDNFRRLAAPLQEDRVATSYELTFDVALHDMFNAWWSGATLCVVPTRSLMAPGHFIRKKQITYWFSVASVAIFMQRQGVLKPGTFPDLRVGMLCGEALPAKTAQDWAKATPNAELYNVYGPTETTMEMAFYRWSDAASVDECKRGIVPIGIPFENHQSLLLDDAGKEVHGEGKGELYLNGPQLGQGYWRDKKRTDETFVTLKNRDGVWYKTGDLVERDVSGLYHFISRVDHQVKLRGNRIELGEVEAALRDTANTDLVAVIPYPVIDGSAQGLIAFVPSDVETENLSEEMGKMLPTAMVPSDIIKIDSFPLNANSKIDRGKLTELLQAAE